MVKILLDPSMYHPHLSVAEECFKAADLGYEYIELSPRADFHEWHHYPKVDDAEVAKVKKAMSASGVKIWTFNPVFNWSSPDEQERQAQVRNFRRLLEIAEELEVPLIATEFSGDPNEPLKSEHQFYTSIEELIPDFEKRGIECTIEAHPYDFVETNERAVQIVRGVNKPWLNYEFCLPHMFHLSEGRGGCPHPPAQRDRQRRGAVGRGLRVSPGDQLRRPAVGVRLRVGGGRRRHPRADA